MRRQDFDAADRVLVTIPKEQRTRWGERQDRRGRSRFWNPGFPPSVVKAGSDSCSSGDVSCLIQLPRTQLLHPRASDHRRIIYTQKSDVFSIFHETWPIWEYYIAKICCWSVSILPREQPIHLQIYFHDLPGWPPEFEWTNMLSLFRYVIGR